VEAHIVVDKMGKITKREMWDIVKLFLITFVSFTFSRVIEEQLGWNIYVSLGISLIVLLAIAYKTNLKI